MYINDTKELRVTKINTPFRGITKTKNINKGQAIMFIGNNKYDINSFINSNILNFNYFKGYYKPRIYRTINSKLRYLYTNTEVYKDINNNDKLKFTTKENIKSYRNINLIDDLTERYLLNLNSLSNKTIPNISNMFYNLLNIEINDLKNNGYDNVSIVFHIDENLDKTLISNIKLNGFPLSIIAKSLKQNKDIEKLKNFDIINYVEPNYLFRLDLKDTNTPKEVVPAIQRCYNQIRSKINTDTTKNELSLNKLSSASNSRENNDKVIEQNKEKITKQDRIESKVSEFMDYLSLWGLNINSDGTPLDKETDINLRKQLSHVLSIQPALLKLDSSALFDNLSTKLIFNNIFQHYRDIKLLGKSNASMSAMSDNLKSKQNDFIESNSDIKKDIENSKKKAIIVKENEKVDTIFKEPKKELKVNSFDNSYYSNQYKTDILNVLKAFNDDPDLPMYILNIDIKDNSDNLNKIDLYNVKYKDSTGNTHNLKLDVPQVIDSKYIYINGSKKIITKQMTSKPVVKISPSEVFITTNYNKLDIQRFGSKFSEQSSKIQKILTDKLIKSHFINKGYIKIKYGKSDTSNTGDLTNLDYNNFSTYILNINDKIDHLNFNQKSLMTDIKSNDNLNTIVFDNSMYFPIGYNSSNQLIVVNSKDNKVYTVGKDNKYNVYFNSIVSLVMDIIERNTDYTIDDMNISSSPSLAYTRARVLGRNVPLISLLGYEKGLINILDMYGIKYEVTTKNKVVKLSDNKVKIKFKDSYLIYDSSSLKNNLLLSGLKQMHPEEYNFNDFNSISVYLDYYDDQFGSRNLAKGFHNALVFLIDPITKEILKDLKLPTDVINLLLYANSLLEDLSYSKKNDMNTYRVRGIEQIPDLMYKVLATSYASVKATANNRNPQKLNVPQNMLIKQLSGLQTIEEASELNPSLSIESTGKVTYKGLTGMNDDRTYSNELRSFGPSAIGVLAVSSPDSNKVNYPAIYMSNHISKLL